MSTLFLIRGLPGSGKTTIAKQMAKAFDMDHYEADMWPGFHVEGYVYTNGDAGLAHKWCFTQVYNAICMKRDVIISNTFTRLWEMQQYYDLGLPVITIEAKGHFDNVHGVPPEKIEAMRTRWEQLHWGPNANIHPTPVLNLLQTR